MNLAFHTAIVVSAPPSSGSASSSTATPSPAGGPRILVDGRVLAGFKSADVEHYLLLDGTTEVEVFTASGCAPCVWPSADGDLVVTPTVTSTGQLSAAVYTSRPRIPEGFGHARQAMI